MTLRLLITNICLLVMLWGCASDSHNIQPKYFGIKKEKLWASSLEKLGYNKKPRQEIILVTYSLHCPACLTELKFWNKIQKKVDPAILLIVLERYPKRYQNFLKRNAIVLPSLRDSSALILNAGLVPDLPIKLYFDEKGRIKSIHYMGNDQDLNSFLSNFSDIRVRVEEKG